MKKIKTKLISCLMSFTMIFSVFPEIVDAYQKPQGNEKQVVSLVKKPDVSALKPEAPTSVQASTSSSEIKLKWNSAGYVSFYEIEINGQNIVKSTNAEYTDEGLKSNTTYTYRIKSVNEYSESDWSGEFKITTQPDLIQNAGEGISGITEDVTKSIKNVISIPNLKVDNVSNNSIQLSWNKVDEAVEYELQVDDNAVSVSNATSYTAEKLSGSSDHKFKIRAKAENEISSDWSSEIDVLTLPDAPEEVNTISTLDSIILTWSLVDGVEGYQVEKDGTVLDGGYQAVFIDDNLKDDSVHKYRVRAINKTGAGEWSSYVSETILKSNLPAVDDNAKPIVNNNNNRNTNNDSNNDNSSIISSLKGDTNPAVKNTQHQNNNMVNTTANTVPQSNNTANISSQNNDADDSEEKPTTNELKTYKSANTGSVAVAITPSITPAPTVKASPTPTPVIKLTPTPTVSVKLDSVINLKASLITGNNAILNWTAPLNTAGITGYNIYSGNTKIASVGLVTSYNITNLNQNTNYTFTVKSVDASENESNGTALTLTSANEKSLILNTDMTLSSDADYEYVTLNSGTLNLNGHTLTVDRDLTQNNNTTINFNSGSLKIIGSYLINGGTISNSNNITSPISIEIDADCIISGNLKIASKSTVTFNVYGNNFNVKQNEKITNSANSPLNIIMHDPNGSCSINGDIENGSNSPISITTTNNCDISGNIYNSNCNNSSITINAPGNCNINGNIVNSNSQNSPITITVGGTFNYKGNILNDKTNKCSINVNVLSNNPNNNCDMDGYNSDITKGNYINNSGSTDSSITINSSYNCKVFSIINSGSTRCNIQIISQNGICTIDGLINNESSNNCYIFITANGAGGKTIINSIDNNSSTGSSIVQIKTPDTIITGNIDTGSEPFIVTGNLYQQSGEIRFEGGVLIIEKDYSISGSAVLYMTNASDFVSVGGSFSTSSSVSEQGKLTNGLMIINGDFSQKEAYDEKGILIQDSVYNFAASDKHIVILNGKKVQNVNFDLNDIETKSRFNVLIITSPFETGYVFNKVPVWNYIMQYSKIDEDFGEATNDDGVYAPTGNFTKTFTDLKGGSDATEIDITRTYNSLDDNGNTGFGVGWSFCYQCNIKDYSGINPTKVVTLPDGSTQTFSVNPDGTFTSQSSRNILKKVNGNYLLITKDQHIFTFNSLGYLISITDKYNNITVITVDSTGKVNKIKDAAGRVYSVTWNDDGLIDTITDPSGRKVTYSYTNKKLTQVTDPMNHIITYGYDINGMLNSIKDNDNKVIESIIYNAPNKENSNTYNINASKVLKTTDEYGNVQSYIYDNAGHTTTITDSNGRKNIQVYDNAFNVISSTDAQGKITQYTYNINIKNGIDYNGEILTETDRNGNKTTYIRDDNGNVKSEIHPDGSHVDSEYDTKNNIIKVTDESGKVTSYIYDSNGVYLNNKVQPMNGTDDYKNTKDKSSFAITTYGYYTKDDMASLGYKVKGLIKYIIDPNGNKTSYTYYESGEVKTVTDAEGKTTTFGYNKIGLNTSVTSPKNITVTYIYDSNQNLIETILSDTLSSKNISVTRVVYDAENRKVKEVSTNQYDGKYDTISYDLNNNVTSENYIDENNVTKYDYSYDTIKRTENITTTVTVTDAQNNVQKYITSCTYDSYGNLVQEVKPDSTVYYYKYDVMNRISNIKYQEKNSSVITGLSDYSYETLSDGRTTKKETVHLNSTLNAVSTTIYDYAGRVIEQDNPDGTNISTHYNPNGTIDSTTDARGNASYYRYDALNRMVEQWTPIEKDKDGTTSLYSYTKINYDKGGRKTQEIVSTDKVTLYAQPAKNIITTSYNYYNNNKLKSQKDTTGRETDYSYDNDGNLSEQDIIVNPNTKIIVSYDNNYLGKPNTKTVHIKTGDLYGNSFDNTGDTTLITSYTYDKGGNVLTVTAPNGVTTTYGYDKLDRQISVSQPGQDENGNPVNIITSQTYNYAGKVLTSTDAKGNKTTYVYDGKQQLVRVIDAKGNIAAFYYDNAGRKTAEVQPGDYIGDITSDTDLSKMNRTEYSYTIMGRLKTVTVTYCNDKVLQTWNSIVTTAYRYDGNGNVTKELDALGYESGTGTTVDAIINSGYGTTITYNLANKPITIQDADTKDRNISYTVKYDYDGLGRKVSETTAAGVVTNYHYDDIKNTLTIGVQKTSADPEKTIKSVQYDNTGNVITETDGNGNITTYQYNGFNKVRSVTYAGDGVTIPQYVVKYQYDVSGNIKQESYFSNNMTTPDKVDIYIYDNQNRVLSKTEETADGKQPITTSVKYDVNGNERFVTDGNGNITTNTYDQLNRLKTTSITITSLTGSKTVETTIYGYDAKGNKTSETDWRGNTTQYAYDYLNRLVLETDAYGKTIEQLEYYDNGAQSKSCDALNNVTRYFYDKNKRLIETRDPENHITQQTYYLSGNIRTKTDGRGNITTFFYDEFNNLITVKNAKGQITSYTYDLDNNMLTETDGKGSTTTYEYNCADKVIRKIDNGGRTGASGSYSYNPSKTSSYTYYADGSLKTVTDRNGIIINYTYDIHGRKLSETAGTLTISFTYDNNDNQLTMTDSTGTTIRTYDELNRVTSKIVPSITGTTGKSVYVYDIITSMAAGCFEESFTDPFGKVTLKIYDKDGRLYKVIAAGITSTYTYYDNGSLETLTYSGGSTANYTYYGDNHLETLINKKADGTVIDSYSYTYDEAGNMQTKTDSKGTTSYTYDSLNMLETIKEPDGTLTKYQFDGAGNRTSETVTKGTDVTVTTYNYTDPKDQSTKNRLIGTTTKLNGVITQTVTYSYDNNGNQLTSVTTTYVNGKADAPQTVKNTYDELNELVKTVNPGGSTIDNIYNGEGVRTGKATNGVTRRYLYEGDKVVLETDAKGNLIARNIYGTNLISRTTAGKTGLYFYNGHGDVTTIINSADGSTLASYYYDEFGNLTQTTETFNNPFRYSGYQFDTETKTYYLMCRMYDPETGRFLQEDSYTGKTDDPLSLNIYTYCHNEPIMYDDPTGHFLKEIYGGIKQVASAAISYTGAAVGGLFNSVAYEPLYYGLKAAGWVENKLTGTNILNDSAKDLKENYIDPTLDFFNNLGGNKAASKVGSFVGNVTGNILNLIDLGMCVKSIVKGAVKLIKNVPDIIKGAGEAIKSVGETIKSAGETIKNIPNAIKNITETAKGFVNVIDESANILKDAFASVKIPQMVTDAEKIQGSGFNFIDFASAIKSGIKDAFEDGKGLNKINETVDDVTKGADKVVKSTPTKTLYHYTNEEGLNGILESKELRPSLKANNPKDARYGNGQYLSNIVPESTKPTSLASKFIRVPNKYKYTHFVEIDVTGLEVVEGRSGVYVIPNEENLDITGRIVRSGKVGK